MKIVVAMDSFKDCMGSEIAGKRVAEGLKRVLPQADVRIVGIGDGGEGTVASLTDALKGRVLRVPTVDALGRECVGSVMTVREASGKRCGFIEWASAAGLQTLSFDERNVMKTSGYGVGLLIRAAISEGCERIVIALGGSATNDAALGALQALGLRILLDDGEELKGPVDASCLGRIRGFDSHHLREFTDGVEFLFLYDAAIDFSGPHGAVMMYARQKGCVPEALSPLDSDMRNLGKLMQAFTGRSPAECSGAGAAGGAGGGLYSFLGARGLRGIDYVLEILHFDKLLDRADLVITGEGRADSQSRQGKAAEGILSHAKKAGVPVVLLAGVVEEREKLLADGYATIIDINAGMDPGENPLDPDVAGGRLRSVSESLARLLLRIT